MFNFVALQEFVSFPVPLENVVYCFSRLVKTLPCALSLHFGLSVRCDKLFRLLTTYPLFQIILPHLSFNSRARVSHLWLPMWIGFSKNCCFSLANSGKSPLQSRQSSLVLWIFSISLIACRVLPWCVCYRVVFRPVWIFYNEYSVTLSLFPQLFFFEIISRIKSKSLFSLISLVAWFLLHFCNNHPFDSIFLQKSPYACHQDIDDKSFCRNYQLPWIVSF